MTDSKRLKLFVDPKVQAPLLRRVAFYWIVSLVLMSLLACIQIGMSSPSASFGLKLSRVLMAFGPSLITAVLILPLVLVDCIRYSNRFAGPMHRLMKHAKQLADTGQAEPITFREGDFWYDLADQFNRIGERMKRLENGDAVDPAASDIAVAAETR